MWELQSFAQRARETGGGAHEVQLSLAVDPHEGGTARSREDAVRRKICEGRSISCFHKERRKEGKGRGRELCAVDDHAKVKTGDTLPAATAVCQHASCL